MANVKRSRSLGLKLVLGVTFLVLVLMGSSFFLAFNFLREETKAFTFEIQANQSQLLGQRFSSHIETIIHTIKIIPSLDRQAIKALENQDVILSLEVFQTGKATYRKKKPSELLNWRGNPGHGAPSIETLDELFATGVTYETATNPGGKPFVYLYSILDGDSEGKSLTFLRTRLNSDLILKKSGATDARIVNRKGKVLLDTRDPMNTGSMVDASDPLLQTASQSPVSIGTLEYTPAGGEARLGTFIIPGFNAIVLNSVRYGDAMRGTMILLERMMFVGLILLGLALVAVVLFSLRITRPLKELTLATQVISKGNFDLNLNETSNDEIGHLSHSMNIMSEKIKALLKESIDKVRIEQELAIASNIQQCLIPPSEIHHDQFTLYSHYQSAAECGGDWWGFIEGPNHVFLIISDATGHGLPPAMLTAVTHGCFSSLKQLIQDGKSPDTLSPSFLLRMANEVVLESSNGEINMTMFIARIDMSQKTLTYSNAGHHSPWLIQRSTDPAQSEFKMLRGRGARLGESKDFAPSEDQVVPFTSNDGLFLYTDGLLENTGRESSPYGKQRLMQLLSEQNLDHAQKHVKIVADLNEFYGNQIPADDLTYVLFQSKA